MPKSMVDMPAIILITWQKYGVRMDAGLPEDPVLYQTILAHLTSVACNLYQTVHPRDLLGPYERKSMNTMERALFTVEAFFIHKDWFKGFDAKLKRICEHPHGQYEHGCPFKVTQTVDESMKIIFKRTDASHLSRRDMIGRDVQQYVLVQDIDDEDELELQYALDPDEWYKATVHSTNEESTADRARIKFVGEEIFLALMYMHDPTGIANRQSGDPRYGLCPNKNRLSPVLCGLNFRRLSKRSYSPQSTGTISSKRLFCTAEIPWCNGARGDKVNTVNFYSVASFFNVLVEQKGAPYGLYSMLEHGKRVHHHFLQEVDERAEEFLKDEPYNRRCYYVDDFY